jgi:hypothetical protein
MRFCFAQIGFTFLLCVLAGLSRAPQYVSSLDSWRATSSPTFWASDVDCVVVPANACGGPGTLAFARMKKHKVFVPSHNLISVIYEMIVDKK